MQLFLNHLLSPKPSFSINLRHHQAFPRYFPHQNCTRATFPSASHNFQIFSESHHQPQPNSNQKRPLKLHPTLKSFPSLLSFPFSPSSSVLAVPPYFNAPAKKWPPSDSNRHATEMRFKLNLSYINCLKVKHERSYLHSRWSRRYSSG